MKIWKQFRAFTKTLSSGSLHPFLTSKSTHGHTTARKDTVMNTLMSSPRGRFTAILAVITAFTLSACGGGSGGNTNPPPPAATGNVSQATGCMIPQDASSCQASVSFSTQNATTPKLTVGTTTVSTAASGAAIPVTIGNGDLAVTLSDGSVILDSTKSLTGSCTPGTTWDGNACKVTVLHYTDKVYALWTDRIPHVVTKTGAVKLKDMTKYAGDHLGIWGCIISSYPLADGRIPLVCNENTTFHYHEFYIDPSKDEMHDFVGTLPADLSYTMNADGTGLVSFSSKWGDVVQDVDPLRPTWEARARVADGWYFTPNNQNAVLYFQDNAGNVSTVAQKTPLIDGNVRIMFSYTN